MSSPVREVRVLVVRGAMEHHPNIRVGLDGHVATVTLDKRESKNACTGDMWVAIGASFRDLSWSGVRAIVLTGAGGHFCAGADLTGGTGSRPDGDGGADGGTGGGDGREDGGARRPVQQLDAMRVLGDVVLAVHDCPVPVVAKVDGVCVGAGLGLALAADLLWCSETARFSAIFAKRGLSLDFGTSWLLRQRIGAHKAKELAFTGRMVSGAEAAELGLVNAAVPGDELDEAVDSVVAEIAGGPPIALSMIKRQLNGAASVPLAQALETEALAQSVNVHTADMREAMMAWFERRPAAFEGR